MKVLVTGGAGFIGSHLVDAYLARGDEVVVVDDFSSGSRSNLAEALKKGVRVVELDIRTNEVTSFIEKEKPDLINHHAAQKSVTASMKSPLLDAEINIVGLLKVLEGAKKAKVARIIFASSGGALYSESAPIPSPETAEAEPLSPYGISKLCSEFYLDFYAKTTGACVVALRYANVYGPRQDPLGEAGVISIFTQALLKGQSPTIYGRGDQSRDFVYVGDIVSANLEAERIRSGFAVVNIGTMVDTSILDLYSEIRSVCESTLEARFEDARAGEMKRSCLDAGLAKRLLHWQPAVSLRAGLEKTKSYFVNA